VSRPRTVREIIADIRERAEANGPGAVPLAGLLAAPANTELTLAYMLEATQEHRFGDCPTFDNELYGHMDTWIAQLAYGDGPRPRRDFDQPFMQRFADAVNAAATVMHRADGNPRALIALRSAAAALAADPALYQSDGDLRETVIEARRAVRALCVLRG